MLTDTDYIVIAGIIVAIVGPILIFRALYRHCILKKVVAVSENYKTLRNLNQSYKFQTIGQPIHQVIHPTKSYKSFQKTGAQEVILYHIENDLDNLRSDIAIAVSNKVLYDNYLADLHNNSVQTSSDKIKTQKISEKKFLKYEPILIKKHLLPIPYSIKLKLKVYYQSPKGRNYYEKRNTFNFEDLSTVYDIWRQHKNYVISAKYERSLMSDSIRYNVLRRDHYRCCICGASAQDGAKLHVDHIVPVSKGGKTVMGNLQTLCERCNLGKSNKL